MLIDSYHQKGQRRRLVEELRSRGIADERVLKAIELVPRHFFFDSSFLDKAYDDNAYPIGQGQTISQPYTVAFQTALLQIRKRDKVLEIGTGSGYQAAILAALGARVYTVERIKKLFLQAQSRFENYQMYGIKTFFKDGFLGLKPYAPFDKMIVTAAAPEIPMPLIEQLKVGGILVIPVGGSKGQEMLRITKISEENEFTEERFGQFRFVPMLKKKVM